LNRHEAVAEWRAERQGLVDTNWPACRNSNYPIQGGLLQVRLHLQVSTTRSKFLQPTSAEPLYLVHTLINFRPRRRPVLSLPTLSLKIKSETMPATKPASKKASSQTQTVEELVWSNFEQTSSELRTASGASTLLPLSACPCGIFVSSISRVHLSCSSQRITLSRSRKKSQGSGQR
jgi:hypothetical protein